jgi:serine protease Do
MVSNRSTYIPAFSLAIAVLLAGCPGDTAAPPAVADRPDGFSSVVEEALPTIVFIQSEMTPPPGLADIFPGLDRVPDEPVPVGMGSGVIYREDGYILTNNHVVQDAERVLVVLHDRRYFEAEVVGRDPSTEVAVVRIQAGGLPAARLGDSDRVRLGDWALALGSPLGLQFSVTAGIVSGTGRAVGILGRAVEPGTGGAAPLEHFIQTDAALSPGNSGGPLLNSRGEVIGINTAVAAPRGVPASIGFAVPSNLARRVADQLVQHGEVRRSYLGVVLTNVSPAMARAHGLPRVEGAAVVQTEPGGPADRGGLLAGDVVRGIEDHEVITASDLQARLVELHPGARITLRILREGREQDVRVELGEVRARLPENRRAIPAGR